MRRPARVAHLGETGENVGDFRFMVDSGGGGTGGADRRRTRALVMKWAEVESPGREHVPASNSARSSLGGRYEMGASRLSSRSVIARGPW